VATTQGKRACPVCGTLFPDDDSALCPVCALRLALETQSDSASDISSELRFEHYRVLQNVEGKPLELGRGGMGVTYKAFDVHLQRPVALKIINAQLFGNDSARLRFVREARAAASVRHPNVASVFHLGESGGNYYYAMEFVEGETLDALIRRSGCLETDLALEMVGQVASGLAAIEKQRLVHRDIKPSNIMVSLQDGKLENVKIIDLGLAKGVAEENTLSTVGAFIGTPAYASPEQFAGIATDMRSDLYSLGVTLWETVSGELPFSGSAAEIMYQHQHAALPTEKLRNISAPVIALLQVLLAKDPSQRFQNPAQLLEALTRIKNAIASKSVLTAKVFISHSSKDKAIAEAICQHLESAGVPCWIAPRDIEPGADWTEGIMRGITSSRLFVLVFSGHANNSEHVRREIGRAFSLHLPVIPLRTEAIEPRDSLGYFLESVQWLDAINPPRERYLPVLTERVKGLLSGEQASTHETAPANEPKQIPNAAPRRKRRLLVIALIGAAAVVAAGIWFFVANSHKANESNPIPASAATPAKSIAVLPFENISANKDKDDAYFADGVQDEILNNLAKIGQLKVISRTSVMQYRAETKRDLRQIANALNVGNVLEGTVRRAGNRVRVSTELIDAQTDNTIWADSYERELNDVLAIQSDIAQTVASKLSARLSPSERKDITAAPTSDAEAYDLYLRAKELVANAELFSIGDERENYLNGLTFLQEAVRKDARFVLAYCLAARANDDLYMYFDRSMARRALGDAAVQEATKLQPDLPEVRLAAARHLYYCYHDYEKARLQITMAERALPNSSDALMLLAMVDRRQGRWEESTKGLQRAVTLDPRNPETVTRLFENYICLRRFREAENACSRLGELEPDKPDLRVKRALCTFAEKADVTGYRAALEALPTSAKNDMGNTAERIYCAALDHDWTAANEVLSSTSHQELVFFFGVSVPRECVEIWLAMAQGGHPKAEGRFAVAVAELEQRRDRDPNDAKLASALGIIDAALGRKAEAIQEAKRALELEPISKDAMEGAGHIYNLAVVYAQTGEPDLAFEQLAMLAKTPSQFTNYGYFKRECGFDPLRKDPRFDKLLARLAPHD
jgi:serine/threonine protein kinase/TolB-like protein/Flp pilus assembly protein TadD